MSLLYKIADAANVMRRSGRGLFSLLGRGASVASTRLLHNCRTYVPQVGTVLDVGANQGQFALAAARFFPEARIYSFEPVPATYQLLQRNTRPESRITTLPYALGSASGTLNFYSNAYSHASSALKISALQQSLLPQTAQAELIQVPVHTLDEIYGTLTLTPPVLLKLDVQGFEREVLRGGGRAMQQVDYLLFETSFVKMYEDEPLFDEMHVFVKGCGFDLVGPVGFLQTPSLQILQLDLLYRKRNEMNG